jgi:hypothetical protein
MKELVRRVWMDMQMSSFLKRAPGEHRELCRQCVAAFSQVQHTVQGVLAYSLDRVRVQQTVMRGALRRASADGLGGVARVVHEYVREVGCSLFLDMRELIWGDDSSAKASLHRSQRHMPVAMGLQRVLSSSRRLLATLAGIANGKIEKETEAELLAVSRRLKARIDDLQSDRARLEDALHTRQHDEHNDASSLLVYAFVV